MRFVLFFTLLTLPITSLFAGNDDIVRNKTIRQLLTDSDSGYVTGYLLPMSRLYFVNVETREQFDSTMGIFCTRLPAGQYIVYKVGTPYGTTTSKDPFSFVVVPGQRKYIGTFVAEWLSDSKRYAADRAKNPIVKNYYLGGLFKTSYDYSVFDRPGEIANRYRRLCPEVDAASVTSELVK